MLCSMTHVNVFNTNTHLIIKNITMVLHTIQEFIEFMLHFYKFNFVLIKIGLLGIHTSAGCKK